MSSLEARLGARIDSSTLAAIAPRPPQIKAAAQKANIEAFGSMLQQIFEAADINTPLRMQHILAQAAHESDGFCTTEEYASGSDYEGRADLGNTYAGDGKKFKGRGIIQLTGRANYRAFTRWMRSIVIGCPDFEQNPEMVASWPWAGWVLAYFWAARPALNAAADRDDLVAVTKIVNGGKNGLADRAAYLAKARAVFLAAAKVAVTRIQGDMISADQKFATLYRGMHGAAVDALQRSLASAGFYLSSIDGDFGAGTETAVKAFQKAKGLTVDGIVGRNTATALEAYAPSEVAA